MPYYQIAQFDCQFPLTPCRRVDYKSSKAEAEKVAKYWVRFPTRSAHIVHHGAVIAKFRYNGGETEE